MAPPSAEELKKLAALRLREAKALMDAGFYDGAWYLCGYTQELAIKACICRTLGEGSYPSGELGNAFKHHRIDDLVLLAGLRSRLEVEFSKRPAFRQNWSLVKTWSTEDRYTFTTRQEVLDLLLAYEDPENGVLTWLSQQW